MVEAHLTAVMAVGKPFRKEGTFDFGQMKVKDDIYKVIPTLSKHRLTPPPKEIYSLHRKIIGCYLICNKLKAKVEAQKIFLEIYNNWSKK